MSFDQNRPYNDLTLLPLKVDLESRAVLKKAIAANKTLAELKGAGELISNQGLLIQAIGLQRRRAWYVRETEYPSFVSRSATYQQGDDLSALVYMARYGNSVI